MIDDKKIEEAANKHVDTEYARYNSGEVEEEMICLRGKDSFKAGAKWAINEFLNDLWHPASEVPRNDYTDILVVCKEPQRPIVLSPEDILDGTPDDIASYNDMWMHLCDVYRITKFCYIGDLLPKTKKGCNHD